MIEKLVTSKTRANLLKHFLTHIDDRYYLRELERLLDESLSPMRRQLLKLVEMNILSVEDEGNIKYYRLNKNFTGMKELRNLVLGREEKPKSVIASEAKQSHQESSDKTFSKAIVTEIASSPVVPRNDRAEGLVPRNDKPEKVSVSARRVRTDLILLSVISLFVLASAIFMVYSNSKNIKEFANIMSGEQQKTAAKNYKRAEATRPDQMTSRSWKLIPGSVPALASGEAGGGGQEL